MARQEGCVWEHSGSCEREVTISETRAELPVAFPANTTSDECADTIQQSLDQTHPDKNLTAQCDEDSTGRRRRRSTEAKFLVIIIHIEELGQTLTTNITIDQNNTQISNTTNTVVTVDFDISQILEEALNVTQEDFNITLDFEVANMTVVENEIKEVNFKFDKTNYIYSLFRLNKLLSFQEKF